MGLSFCMYNYRLYLKKREKKILTYNVSCTVCRGNILRGFFDTYILFEYTAMVTRLASEFPPGILLSFALL